MTSYSLAAGGFVLSLALLFGIYLPYRIAYFPFGDDYAVVAHSALLMPGSSWHDWFFPGYRYYFDGYPEWFASISDFARPVANAITYALHAICGRHWGAYLLFNDVAHAAGIAAAMWVCHATLRLPVRDVVFGGLLMLLAPAAMSGTALTQISFAPELLLAPLAVATFSAVMSGRIGLATMIGALGLLTKETALWIPVAAAITALLLPMEPKAFPRRLTDAALLLAPLGCWAVYRFACFGGIAGTYVVHIGIDPIFLAKSLIYDIAVWPTGLLEGAEFGEMLRGRFALSTIARLAGNLGAWALMGTAATGLYRELRTSGTRPDRREFATILWSMTGLAFVMALSLHSARFGYGIDAFLLPLLVWSARQMLGTRCLTTGLAVLSISAANLPLGSASPDRAAADRSAALAAIIASTPPDTKQIFLIDDPATGYSAPSAVSALLQSPGEIIKLTNLVETCRPDTPGFDVQHNLVTAADNFMLRLPDCAQFEFPGARPPIEGWLGGTVSRGEEILYKTPNARLSRAGTRGDRTEIDYGPVIDITIHPNGQARFIVFDPGHDRFDWYDQP